MDAAVEAAGMTADVQDGESEYEPRLWPLLVSELLFLAGGVVVVAASLLGRSALLTGYSVRLRAAALVVLTVELLIPLGIYLDLRRRQDDPDTEWLHAAVMPVVNVFGLVAYLEGRRRQLEE